MIKTKSRHEICAYLYLFVLLFPLMNVSGTFQLFGSVRCTEQTHCTVQLFTPCSPYAVSALISFRSMMIFSLWCWFPLGFHCLFHILLITNKIAYQILSLTTCTTYCKSMTWYKVMIWYWKSLPLTGFSSGKHLDEAFRIVINIVGYQNFEIQLHSFPFIA